jgi:hypothetical protein
MLFQHLENQNLNPLPNLRGWRKNETEQRTLFEAIAGQWMGPDRRRGSTYLWLVGHLADAKGETSPRSFVLALKEAARRTRDRYRDGYALHYRGSRMG